MPLPTKTKKINLPSLEEDFVPVDPIEEDEIDYTEGIPEAVYIKPKIPKYSSKNKKKRKLFDSQFIESNDEKEDSIDKKKKKIIPTGGKKSLARAKDFDDRKNTLVWIKVARTFVFLIIVCLFALGLKNTYFPEQIYTPEEIEDIANSAVGDTGFPKERGRAFAQEFLYYYMKADTSDTVSRQILNSFYQGKNGNSTAKNRTDVGSNKQRPLMMPILFDEFTPTPYTGVYKFSILLSDSDGTSLDEEIRKVKAHWLSFSVNVYYDKKTDSLAIHPDSPTIIPTYNVSSATVIPNEKPLGTGERDTVAQNEMNSTIDGFIEAYSKVDLINHSEIDQYIPVNPPVELISGFGGTVSLAKDVRSSIFKEVFSTDKPNEWKVNVKVQWKNTQVTGESNEYQSRYVMTVQKTSDDVFLVTRFVPYTFIEKVIEEES